jgi:hypothetical protein
MIRARSSAAFASILACVGLAALGAEPAEKPTTTAAPVVVAPPAKATFRVYLLMGQSNMAGRDRRTLADQVDDPRILALNADGHWVVARDPMHPKQGRTEPGVGPGIPFARAMAAADPNVTIGLVPCAVGGTSLRAWVKGAEHYEAALKRAKLAQETGTIAGVLWHQGESDTTNQKYAESHGTRLAKMFKDLRQDLGQPELPIVVGQIGDFLSEEKYPFAAQVREGIRQVPTTLPNVGYADSAGLIDKGDKLHFDAKSEEELGARFAKAMQALKQK